MAIIIKPPRPGETEGRVIVDGETIPQGARRGVGKGHTAPKPFVGKTPDQIIIERAKEIAVQQQQQEKQEEIASQQEAEKEKIISQLQAAEPPPPTPIQLREDIAAPIRKRLTKQERQTPSSFLEIGQEPKFEIPLLVKGVKAGIKKKLSEKEIQQTKSVFLKEKIIIIEPDLSKDILTRTVKGIKYLPTQIITGGKEILKEAYTGAVKSKQEKKLGFSTKQIIEMRKQDLGELFSKPEVQTTVGLAALIVAPGIIQFAFGTIYAATEAEQFMRGPTPEQIGRIAFIVSVPLLTKGAKQITKGGVKAYRESVRPFVENYPVIKEPGTPYLAKRPLGIKPSEKGSSLLFSKELEYAPTKFYTKAGIIEAHRLETYTPQLSKSYIKTESGKVVGTVIDLKPGQQKFGEVFTAPKVKTAKTESGIQIEIGRPPKNIVAKTKDTTLSKAITDKIITIAELREKLYNPSFDLTGQVSIIKVSQPFKAEKLPDIPTLKTTPSKIKTLQQFGIKKPIKETPKNIIELKKISKPLITPRISTSKKPTEITSGTNAQTVVILKETKSVKPTKKAETTSPFPTTKGKGFFDVEYIYAPTKETYEGISSITKAEVISQQKLTTKQEQYTGIIPISKIDIKPEEKIKAISAVKTKAATTQLPRQFSSIVLGTDIIQEQKQKQEPIAKITQIQDPVQDLVQIQRPIEEFHIPKQEEPFQRQPPPPLPLPRIKLKQRGSPKQFKVKVRRRGKFDIIGTFKTGEAAGLAGKKRVLGTAAASFKVELRGQTILLPISDRRFRPSKKEPGVMIQRRKFRISSPGEKKEITKKGLAAIRIKKINMGKF